MKLLNKLERRLTALLLERRSAGREFAKRPDDVMVVSYPRSGNTWTRFMIANVVRPEEPATFQQIERRVPDIYKASRELLASTPSPRVLKSHEYFDPRYRKVIYIVRDPRDVAVSYYHYHRKMRVIDDAYPIRDYIQRFVAGELDTYGSWGDNVAGWVATRDGSSEFLLLRYEDMLAEPVEALSTIATFLHLARDRGQLESAVAHSSAAEMRDLEKKSQGWKVTDTSRADIPFVRTATVGGWKGTLGDDQVRAIEQAWRGLMIKLRYLPS